MQMMQYLYELIPGTNVSKEFPLLLGKESWKSHSILTRFDQREFISEDNWPNA